MQLLFFLFKLFKFNFEIFFSFFFAFLRIISRFINSSQQMLILLLFHQFLQILVVILLFLWFIKGCCTFSHSVIPFHSFGAEGCVAVYYKLESSHEHIPVLFFLTTNAQLNFCSCNFQIKVIHIVFWWLSL